MSPQPPEDGPYRFKRTGLSRYKEDRMQTSTSQHRGRVALPATLEAARDDLAWGQAEPWSVRQDYRPGEVARAHNALSLLAMSVSSAAPGEAADD